MFLFNNKKDEPTTQPTNTATSVGTLDPEDFFKDIGRKAQPKKVETTVEAPDITGLRDAPLPSPQNTIINVNVNEEGAAHLVDKSLLDDGAYHGNMVDVDESKIDISTLEDKKEAVPYVEPVPVEKTLASNDPDNFFKDMGRKKPKPSETTVEPPAVTGLRDAPDFVKPNVLDELATDDLSVDELPVKAIAKEEHLDAI